MLLPHSAEDLNSESCHDRMRWDCAQSLFCHRDRDEKARDSNMDEQNGNGHHIATHQEDHEKDCVREGYQRPERLESFFKAVQAATDIQQDRYTPKGADPSSAIMTRGRPIEQRMNNRVQLHPPTKF